MRSMIYYLFFSPSRLFCDKHLLFKCPQENILKQLLNMHRLSVTTVSSASKDFMMELTAHQSSVGNVLQAGNQLIAQGNLTEEEEDEIREQMSLLNSRWESLRVASMDRQAR